VARETSERVEEMRRTVKECEEEKRKKEKKIRQYERSSEEERKKNMDLDMWLEECRVDMANITGRPIYKEFPLGR
jgi:hypothetical protein